MSADRIAEKVRALLDKAESTTFDAERETFLAAATRLMVRHQVDEAMLARAGRRSDRGAVGIRQLDGQAAGPYAIAHAAIAVAAATATGATTWRSDGAIVFAGFEDQLDASEAMYTSLLLQATLAVEREFTGGGRGRLSFTRNFLIGFGHRVGQRLRESAEEAKVEAERTDPGAGLALRDVGRAIEDHLEREGIGFRRDRVRVDPGTYGRGVRAGDHADIGRPGVGDGSGARPISGPT